LAAIVLAAEEVAAANVMLSWQPNTEATLAGYKIHYGSASKSYSSTVALSRETSCTIGDLQVGKTYFFAATAFDIYGNQSDYSNEVSYTVPNNPPLAQQGTLNTQEDTAAVGTLRATDPEGQTLVFSIVSPPAKGGVSLIDSSTGAFKYIPNSNANGIDSFTFKTNDGNSDSNTASVSVSISAVNDPPTAEPDQATATQGTPITINVLANDRDVDGDTLSLVRVGSAANGQASITSTAVRYTPLSTFTGTDSFTYTVSDNRGGTASASVTIQVLNVNSPPIARDSSISVRSDSSVVGILTATDLDGNALQYSILSSPSKGTVRMTNSSTGTFTYTALPNATGSDLFTFKANDGKTDSNIATVAVTISRPGNVVFALNAGGPRFVDRNGVTYAADSHYTGGGVAKTTSPIADTLDDTLYQSERNGNFAYAVPLSNGHYLVTLKFVEMTLSTNNQSVFDVLMEGREVLANFDVYANVGTLRAYDLQIPVRITDGTLNLSTRADIGKAKLCAFTVQNWDDPIRWGLNSGGPRNVDTTDEIYQHDMLYTGGWTGRTIAQIVGTENSRLYKTERAGRFKYDIPFPNGVYQVTMKFAEIYWTNPGQRIFEVSAEGQKVIANLDLLKLVNKNEAYDYTFLVTVNDGVLNLSFVPTVNYPKLSAIFVEAF
jgi:hypothetical protein